MRYAKLFLLLLAFVFGGALIGAPSAKAASFGDNYVNTINPVYASLDGDNFGIELNDWYNIIQGTHTAHPVVLTGCSTTQINLAIAKDDGGIFIRQHNQYQANVFGYNASFFGTSGTIGTVLEVTFQADAGASSLVFTDLDSTGYSGLFFNISGGTTIFTTRIAQNPAVPGELLVQCSSSDSGQLASTALPPQGASWSPGTTHIFYSSYPVDYPVGFDGTDVPNVPPSPSAYTDWAPDWYISFGFDYEVTIHDSNFNTFDDNPFLCDDGLAPAIYWEIKDDSNVVLFSGTQSPTMQIVRKLPTSSSAEDYTITGIYNCGEGDLQFDQYGTLNFTLTDTGLLQQTSLQDCFQGDIPFVFDINACMEHFSSIFSLLSFGQIKLGDSWNYGNTGCGYLTVLHDWLGLPNGTQICPQFSETIRNTVTPFLSVLLGLVTLGFISRLDNNKGGI